MCSPKISLKLFSSSFGYVARLKELVAIYTTQVVNHLAQIRMTDRTMLTGTKISID